MRSYVMHSGGPIGWKNTFLQLPNSTSSTVSNKGLSKLLPIFENVSIAQPPTFSRNQQEKEPLLEKERPPKDRTLEHIPIKEIVEPKVLGKKLIHAINEQLGKIRTLEETEDKASSFLQYLGFAASPQQKSSNGEGMRIRVEIELNDLIQSALQEKNYDHNQYELACQEFAKDLTNRVSDYAGLLKILDLHSKSPPDSKMKRLRDAFRNEFLLDTSTNASSTISFTKENFIKDKVEAMRLFNAGRTPSWFDRDSLKIAFNLIKNLAKDGR